MSMKNFIPTIWSESILREREKNLVAAKLCNRDYEGEIKDKGDKVKINGVGRPTIIDYDDVTGLGDFERLPDQSTMLEITESKAFHFYVGDIDRRQAKGDLMSAEQEEAGAALAEVCDTFIYQQILKDVKTKVPEVTSLTAAIVISTLTEALTKLYNNHVPKNETVSLEASPNFCAKLMLAKLLQDTDNSKVLTSGMVGRLKVLNLDVYMSHNIPAYSTAGDYAILRTKKAVSFAEQIKEIEAYKPEQYFGEAVKGLQVYGAKVIRPKEAVLIPVKAYGTETTI